MNPKSPIRIDLLTFRLTNKIRKLMLADDLMTRYGSNDNVLSLTYDAIRLAPACYKRPTHTRGPLPDPLIVPGSIGTCQNHDTNSEDSPCSPATSFSYSNLGSDASSDFGAFISTTDEDVSTISDSFSTISLQASEASLPTTGLYGTILDVLKTAWANPACIISLHVLANTFTSSDSCVESSASPLPGDWVSVVETTLTRLMGTKSRHHSSFCTRRAVHRDENLQATVHYPSDTLRGDTGTNSQVNNDNLSLCIPHDWVPLGIHLVTWTPFVMQLVRDWVSDATMQKHLYAAMGTVGLMLIDRLEGSGGQVGGPEGLDCVGQGVGAKARLSILTWAVLVGLYHSRQP